MQHLVLSENFLKQINLYYTLATKLLPQLITIIATLIIASYIIKAIHKVIDKSSEKLVDKRISTLLKQAIKLTIWAVASLNIFSVLGVDIMPLLASLGLTGFALGLACKDMLENIIAGIMLLFYRPFNEGDDITFAGNSGRVKTINYRFTELYSSDGKTILIPNAMLLKNVISVSS
jgi:small conductance mechanosensitive channel